ncbi:2OG-Fe(II) oxygenase [Lysobacter panacisoli]|uniref:2OG-Fe(II) oxygenase family protein n=1 Tax=Lysobacter panacisoli TaxID=1255263 RepID=A0ABP9KWA7_9GAMM|nr:2OG-Fe(II) oxygenase family protein [Lysobacter panacisoli]
MIGDRVDVPLCRERLLAQGRAQVPDYLQPEVAQRLHDCLAREVPWTLAVRDGTGARTIEHAAYAAMDAEQRARLLADVADAKGAFRFAYESYMMVTAYQEGRDPDLALHRVLEVFNSPQYLAFLRELTGDVRIRRVNAQATRYRAGHFLRYHTDAESREGRLYAYVLNLTRDWHADWGGLLQFVDGEGRVTDTFLPRWNTLSLFKVPTGHAVSLVAPWAEQDRMAITGWFLS